MDASRCYRLTDPQLCQGDVFEAVPHLLLKSPPTPLKPTTLSGKKPGLHVELLDRIHRRQKGRSRIPRLGHAHTVQRVLVVEIPLARRADREARPGEGRISVAGRARSGSGHKLRELNEIASVQGQILHLLLVDHRVLRRVLGLQLRRSRLDSHLFGSKQSQALGVGTHAWPLRGASPPIRNHRKHPRHTGIFPRTGVSPMRRIIHISTFSRRT